MFVYMHVRLCVELILYNGLIDLLSTKKIHNYISKKT